jgi:hypothetical protein
MAKYHSAPFKEGEIFFYPNLGALANFEDFSGQGIAEAFSGNSIPKLDLIYVLLLECHKVACIRKSLTPVLMEDLKTWIEGKDVMKLFNDVLADLLIELGMGEQTQEKKS